MKNHFLKMVELMLSAPGADFLSERTAEAISS